MQKKIRSMIGLILVVSIFGGISEPAPARAAQEGDVDGNSKMADVLSGEPISLPEALDEALSRRPALHDFRHQLEARKDVVGEARSNYMPQLSASYQNIYGNSFLGVFLFPGFQYFDLSILTVTLNQNIYDFGRTSSQVKQARMARKGAQSALNKEVLDLRQDVTVSYLTLLMAQHALKSAFSGVRDARHHLEEAEARLSAGVGIRLDVTQARVNLETALLQRIRAMNDFRTAQIELSRTIGIKKNPHYVAREISLDRFKRSIRLESDIRLAYRQHPDLKQIESQVREGEARLANAKSQNWPTINGVGQYFMSNIPAQALGISYMPNYPFSTFNIGGVVNVPIFEGGLISHQVHEARSRLASTNDQFSEAKLRVSAEVREAALNVRAALQRWSEARTAFESARENDRLVEKSFKVGTARSVDVVDAETALRQAREDLVQARYDWAIQMIRYRHSLGDMSMNLPSR